MSDKLTVLAGGGFAYGKLYRENGYFAFYDVSFIPSPSYDDTYHISVRGLSLSEDRVREDEGRWLSTLDFDMSFTTREEAMRWTAETLLDPERVFES